jgi:hypothetical protein
MSEEEKRKLSEVRSEAGKKGRAASPWNRGPHCKTPNARRTFIQLKETPHGTTRDV